MTHDPDCKNCQGSGYVLVTVARTPLTPERWMREPCPMCTALCPHFPELWEEAPSD